MSAVAPRLWGLCVFHGKCGEEGVFFLGVFGVCGLRFFQRMAAWLRINCIFAENMEKNMNSELIIKKRILRENRRSTDNYVFERELRNSVGPEEFRAKLVETVAKR
jgi:hypothetical protein